MGWKEGREGAHGSAAVAGRTQPASHQLSSRLGCDRSYSRHGENHGFCNFHRLTFFFFFFLSHRHTRNICMCENFSFIFLCAAIIIELSNNNDYYSELKKLKDLLRRHYDAVSKILYIFFFKNILIWCFTFAFCAWKYGRISKVTVLAAVYDFF